MPFALSTNVNGDVVLTGTNGDDLVVSQAPFLLDGDQAPNVGSIITSGFVQIDVPLAPNQGLIINARGGNDTIQFDPAGTAADLQVAANIDGGGGADSIEGGRLGDTINGDNGADFLDGNEGNDIVNGGNGRDTVQGGTGADTMSGGAGNDSLQGQGGADDLSGNDGNDTVRGGAGNDVLNGGKGNDSLFGGGGAEDTFEWGDGPGENRVSDFDGDFDRVQGFTFRETLDFTGINDIDSITILKLAGPNVLLTIQDDDGHLFDVRVATNVSGVNRLLGTPELVIDTAANFDPDTDFIVA